MVRMKQNISLLLQRAQIKQTLEILLTKKTRYMKYGDRFGGADRIINLEHPVEPMVEHEKRGRSYEYRLLPH